MTHPPQIVHGPSFALLKLKLSPGETITAEAGAMVARRGAIHMRTRLNARRGGGWLAWLGSFLVALVRKFVGGETFMVNDFSCTDDGANASELWLAPTFSGTVVHKRLENQTLLLSAGAFLGMAGDLDLRLRWGGLRALLAREGLFFLELSGTGDLFYGSYGGTYDVDVDGTFVVDNGHLVAFDPALNFSIRSPGGGGLGFLASGEGLVMEFQGRGKVTLQSRNVAALVHWLSPLLPG